MCRSIKTLRPPFTEDAGEEDVRAAALQYIRKVSGFRVASRANEEAFDRAVGEVSAATRSLLAELRVGARQSAGGGAQSYNGVT
ncbi:MAG: DUF2277 domain-containing protein [Sporichthyaceae bacterium]|nr:DUF2277 domain-containing protein [Sporichthyaceae bacterium]